MMGGGMMENWQGSAPTGQRMTIAQAIQQGQKHLDAVEREWL